MHLCYMYIFNYQGKIQNTGLTFNPNYEFSFDAANNTLTIRKSDKPLPKDFWGEDIYSVTALLGNNGAGKSTVMSAIMEATVEGNGDKENIDAILVYENIEGNKEGKLYYYCNRKDIKVIGAEEVAPIFAYGYEAKPISINTFYYTGHFSPHVNADIRWSGWEGLYNASDTLLLIKDYELKENKEALSMIYPLRDYLMDHVTLNNKRICELLSNDDIRNELKELPNFTGPNYLVLTPNRQYLRRPILQQAIAEKVSLIQDPKEKCLAGFIFQGILNGISTEINSIRYKETQNDRLSTYGENLLDKWMKVVNYTSDVLPQFETFVNSLENSLENDSHLFNYKEQLKYLYKILSNFNQCACVDEQGQFFYFDFEQDTNSIKNLFSYSTPPFFISFFVNFSYSKSIENKYPTLLSSGELAILNIFSRLYDAIVVKPKVAANLYSPTLLLLDETELGLHPEWQRQYISVLLHFLQLLTKKGKTEKQGQGEANGLSFQIVLASHSPILLSDIPRACSNYLCEKNENNYTDIKETFASNIFELYRNSFFMKNGMIGAFAEEKVQSLLNRIQNKRRKMNDKVIKEIETEIEMIGDERVRLYLLHEMEKRIDQRPLDEQIAYYQKKLQELNGKNA